MVFFLAFLVLTATFDQSRAGGAGRTLLRAAFYLQKVLSNYRLASRTPEYEPVRGALGCQ
jgi:hypothetical protein